MFANKNRKEALDRAGRSLLKAARATDAETRQAAESPFLYARIRARIEAESDLKQPPSLLWLVGRRAIPVLTLVAVLALGSFWVFGSRAAAPSALSATNSTTTAVPPNPILTSSQPNFIPSACSIATKDECSVSTNDVIAILTTSGEGQTRR